MGNLSRYDGGLFLAASVAERVACQAAQAATVAYQMPGLACTPSVQRYKLLHILRKAARRCPYAMFSLGTILAEEATTAARDKLTTSLFQKAANIGLSRLKNPEDPCHAAPDREYFLRDIVSRCITNIGGRMANRGNPAEAVPLFRQAITLFPENANAHVCLGQMGINRSGLTEVTAMEALQAWKTATTLVDYCKHSTRGRCACRCNVVSIGENIRSLYGEKQATYWLTKRYARMSGYKEGTEFSPVASTPRDIAKLGMAPWSEAAVSASEALSSLEARFGRNVPIEVKVTLAATILASLSVLDDRDVGDAAMIKRAKDRITTEPLAPFIGDDEWENVAPPRTNFLGERETIIETMETALFAVRLILADAPDLDPEEAIMAFLFHLDSRFRDGVTTMVIQKIENDWKPDSLVYVPAFYIGDPAELGVEPWRGHSQD
ncbi:hypothetical protein OIU34_23780 [Pararhizobium sp. BT-229]|uniref:hypothetical protein n=1 Tax=Pararhizobium sp. BT-229 TaxID=2986923 RepID=UPI0021F6B233|nr:hypothetical protein [Pararhizobium sp. BT-229]MCV9964918.1 hypothetical protein [Pararhizobium sp. BT-229]